MITQPKLLSIVTAMFCTTICSISHAATQLPPPPTRTSTMPVALPNNHAVANGVTQIAPKLDVDGSSVKCGQTIKLHAMFYRAGVPFNGASLRFKIDDASVGQGVTDAAGSASVEYKPTDNLTAGEHTIQVTLPADGKTAAISGSAKLTVAKSTSNLKVKTTLFTYPGFINAVKVEGELYGEYVQTYLPKQKMSLRDNGVAIETTTTLTDGSFAFNTQYTPQAGHQYTVTYDGNGSCMSATQPASITTGNGLLGKF